MPLRPSRIEVLFARPPALDAPRVAAPLARLAPAGVVAQEVGGVSITLGASTFFAREDSVVPLDELEESESQTWNWPEAADRTALATHRVILEETGTLDPDRGTRLKAVHACTRALMELEAAVCIHWSGAQRLVDPYAYAQSLEGGASLIDGPVNVRLFRISDGRRGETLMDTRGLDVFGLPDLQIHFHSLDPARIAEVLVAYAEYLFEKGDVLSDDSLVRGIDSTHEWACKRGPSLVPPSRDVVDVVPDAFAVPHDAP